MKKLAWLLLSICLVSGHAARADQFAKLRCDADIPKAMIGQKPTNQRNVVLEKKYSALGLKVLGGYEISERLSTVNWWICGAEYITLSEPGRIRDAIRFPEHSKRAPAYEGTCRLNGQELPDAVVAVLDGAAATEYLPAQVAWKIDEQQAKFVKLPVEGLVCPRKGIYTLDGGS